MTTPAKLVKKARAAMQRGDAAIYNGDQYYILAGECLAKAKDACGHGEWLPMLKKVRISQQRASELMRFASGEITVDEVREAKRRSMKKSRKRRAKSPQRGGDLGTNGAACNYNPEDPEHVREPGDSKEAIRHRIFLHRAAEALRHAKENGFDEAADSEIDKEIIRAAQTAAEAWSDLYKQLLARQTARKGGKINVKEKASETQTRQAIH